MRSSHLLEYRAYIYPSCHLFYKPYSFPKYIKRETDIIQIPNLGFQNMNNKLSKILWLTIVVIGYSLIISCNTVSLQPAPQSFGSLNRIVVVADQNVWDGPVGDTLRYYLAAAYPVLPQPEPLFDLQHFTMHEIDEDNHRKRFRFMIFLGDVEGTSSPTGTFISNILGEENMLKLDESEEKSGIKISENRWANNQNVLFFYSKGEAAMIQNIKDKSASISSLVRKSDASMLDARTYISGRSSSLMNLIKEDFGLEVQVPGDYILAHHNKEKGFIWMRKFNKHAHNNIFVYKVPYKDTDQLKPENIKSMRDSIGKWYVESGQVDGSFMRVNDIDLSLYHENRPIDGKFSKQLKGIWEMSDPRDMMGGPFATYVIHDADKNELIFVDGFVYAPGKKKRDLMQGVELILSKTKVLE